MGVILAYLNEAFILASAILMAVGWFMIRRRNVEAHRRCMIFAVILAVLFFVSYVMKTILYGDTSFGGPHAWKIPFQVFLQIHSVLATVGAILGIITLRFALKGRFASHRKVGPWTAVVWFITAFSGLMVFLLLYVAFPSGPTTNLFRAWIGH